jgi:hypothetical protein
MTSWPSVGVLSDETVPSASHPAVTPADVTPFQVLLVVWTPRHTRRHGEAAPAFVSMIDGSRYRGSRYAPPVPVFSISAARQATTSTYASRS